MVGSGKKRHFSLEQYKKDYQAWLENELAEQSAKIANDVKKDLGLDEDETAKYMRDKMKEDDKYLFNEGKSTLESVKNQKLSKVNANVNLTPEDKNKQIYDIESQHLENMRALYAAYGENVAEIDRQISENKAAYNAAIVQAAQERAKVEVETGYQAGQAAAESAATVEEATKNVLNSIRSAIKAKISEAIAIQLVKVLETVPFPFNFAVAATAGAAVSLLFDKLIPQFAEGRYPVTGAQDGHTYQAGYQNGARTGFYNRPTLIGGLGLVGERGREIVISNPHVRHLQMNYPEVIRTIMATRVPQYAGGNYPVGGRRSGAAGAANEIAKKNEDAILMLLGKLVELNSQPFRGYITYNDLNEKQTEVANIENSIK